MLKLSGLVASYGIASGVANIVTNGKTHGVLVTEKPYIVVADLTTPDLTSLLVDAQAVVTDIGGLSSHAANISRELGIPCIVSTKYATLRINPSDYVTVNANENEVTWIPSSNCVYCGKSNQSYVLESEHFYGIFDGFPVREGHLLIIPKRHILKIEDLIDIEFFDLYIILRKGEKLLRDRFNCTDYNLGINNGSLAGQTIPHLHIHLIPRYQGDVENPRGGIRNFLPNPLTKYPED